MSVSTVEPRPKKQSTVRMILDLLVDNPLLDNDQIAALLQVSKRTVQVLRASDSFKATLALMIEKRHGDAIRAVRNNTLTAANEALDAARRIMADPATLQSVKLETIKLVLENNQRTEDRLVPKGPVQPGGQNVTINLNVAELQEAQNASIAHGNIIELEPSDVALSHEVQIPGRGLLPAGNRGR